MTTTDRIAALEKALEGNVGVVTIKVDNTQVTYDRAQAIKELEYWRKRKTKDAHGTFRSLDLRRAF